MKIRTQVELEKDYQEFGGVEESMAQRTSMLAEYPYSVLITADYIEIENAKKWCSDNTGNWTSLWYGKIDYDYGYVEFLFKEEEDKFKFKDIVESLITQYPSGVKGKTEDDVNIEKDTK